MGSSRLQKEKIRDDIKTILFLLMGEDWSAGENPDLDQI